MSNVVVKVEDGIQGPICMGVHKFMTPMTELTIKTSSGRDASSVTAVLKCWKRQWSAASFETNSQKNNQFHEKERDWCD